MNIQGVNKKMDPLLQKFTLFLTIFTAFFIILTVTVYSHLTQNNLLFTCQKLPGKLVKNAQWVYLLCKGWKEFYDTL